MTDSIREQIMVRIEGLLNASGAGKPSGLKVERFRLTPIETSELPHQNLRPQNEPVDMLRDRGGIQIRTLNLVIEHRAVPASGKSADQALDKSMTWATRQLMTDPRQATLARSTREGEIEWGKDEDTNTIAMAKQPFAIVYATGRMNQESKT
jgi:hypothetical protein